MKSQKEKDEQKILRYIKKIKSINYLGGCCLLCKEDNIFKLTFHHRNPKEKERKVSDILGNRWSSIITELDKCDLLCQNCHREYHYNESNLINDKRRNDKKIYLEYSGNQCMECGYDKCESSLSFHHRNPKEKSYEVSSLWNIENKSLNELDKHITDEIDKCDILCSNCHSIKHIDILFFNSNKDIIYNRLTTYKETREEIDRNVMIDMHKKGIRNIDIAKHFNASTGTISSAIKKWKTKNEK